jgi:Outer membrane protein beta-barrel domain
MKFRFVRTVVLLFVFLSTQSTYAQKFISGFGIGGQMTSASYKDSAGNKKTTNFRAGARVYWNGRVNLEGNISFTPEVGYTMKGFRVKNPNSGVTEQELILHYVEFMFLQEYAVKDKFFVKVGPSISAAFAGRDKQLSATNLRSNKPLAFNFAEWGRFEASINLGVGSHFGNGWAVELRATKGVSNIYDGDDGPKVKNILFGINITKYMNR